VASFAPFWLDEYALYMALRDHFNSTPWFEWPDTALKMHEEAAVENAKKNFAGDIAFYKFVQWLFDEQWKVLKAYANDHGVRIIGDVPFYISEDSAEVWSNRQMFALDEHANFLSVAGAPPDYFNSDGQHWGNPIYNWEYLAETGYKWWISRMKEALYRYDVVRIDHFRGFEAYWNIPADSPTARGGYWVKGPGIAPFRAMEKELGKLPVLAENLGDVGREVDELLEQSGFLGMGVLQFGFMGDPRHLPHNYSEKTAAYTGTHDNTTLLDWIMQLDDKGRDDALFYSGFTGDWGQGGPNCGICEAWIRILYLSKAALVIVPIQDLLGYGRDTRTNVPGTAEGNWRFRVTSDAISKIDTDFYRRLAETAKQFETGDLE
jgi:4-alpha-glucanotransferase